MTLLRHLSNRISAFVSDHASPGSTEWAEALAREADFIENDWNALSWSLGSIRVLLNYREAPLRSLTELTRAAEKYAESKRQRFGTANAVWITNVLQLVLWTILFCMSKNLPNRIAYSALALAYLPMAIYNFSQSRREFDVPDRFDPAGMIQYYKAGLENVTNLLAPSFLINTYHFIALSLGIRILYLQGFWGLIPALLFTAIGIRFLQKRQNNLRRLDQINVLLASGDR